MNVKAVCLGAIAIAMSASAGLAHHSFTMFDGSKTVIVDGTVKEYRFTNPHAWIFLEVANAQGEGEQWAIEMAAPVNLVRQGVTAQTMTPGMKVKVLIHPMADGTHGGQFMTVTLPDGAVKGFQNGAPQ